MKDEPKTEKKNQRANSIFDKFDRAVDKFNQEKDNFFNKLDRVTLQRFEHWD